MKLIRTRELLSRYPWLDTLRMEALGWICNHGTSFFDRQYSVVRIMAPGAQTHLLSDGKPVIYALYHGCMIGVLGLKPRKKLTVLVSQSRDGEMIARGITGLGFSVARGSPAKGGVKGAREMIEAARGGQSLIFMVDGPRGPEFKVKPGIIRLAEMTGLPVLPVGLSSRTAMYMSSWDSFMASVWSTPMAYVFGEPIHVPSGAPDDLQEELRAALEIAMSQLKATAESVWLLSK